MVYYARSSRRFPSGLLCLDVATAFVGVIPVKLAVITEYPWHNYWPRFMLDKVLGPAIGTFAEDYKTAFILR
jgi:hypothetical protein